MKVLLKEVCFIAKLFENVYNAGIILYHEQTYHKSDPSGVIYMYIIQLFLCYVSNVNIKVS